MRGMNASLATLIKLLILLLLSTTTALAFHSQSTSIYKLCNSRSRISIPKSNTFTFLLYTTGSSSSSSSCNTISEEKSSDETSIPRETPWFKQDERKINRRIDIKELHLGQKLQGIKLEQECLLGKTGPKDCGVAKYITKRNVWSRVNGMVRIGTTWEKRSLHRKRAAKLRKKQGLIDVYVSRIYTANGRLEVSLDPVTDINKQKNKIPISTLQPKQEITGVVSRVEPYGVLVDVGANRLGLLHIQKVADLYQRYIKNEKGLEEAGLEKGANIRVQILENKKKRLFLDFTDDVKQEAEVENQEEENEKESSYLSDNEAAEWAAFAAADDDFSSQGEKEEGNEYGYDDAADWEEFAKKGKNDDEDRKIEDALGLGSY